MILDSKIVGVPPSVLYVTSILNRTVRDTFSSSQAKAIIKIVIKTDEGRNVNGKPGKLFENLDL
jgi:hypothetical protein